MQIRRLYCSILVMLLVMGGCAAPDPFLGSEWRLLEFQSMDDSIGTLRPDAAQEFTMRLNADGTVNMQLDCNYANGSWSHVPSEAGDSGSFSLGPLVTTRALCRPPNFDERFVRDAEYLRSYLLRDGRLYLSLMADGGIYVWESTGGD